MSTNEHHSVHAGKSQARQPAGMQVQVLGASPNMLTEQGMHFLKVILADLQPVLQCMHSDLGRASWVGCGPGTLHDCRTGPASSKDTIVTMTVMRNYSNTSTSVHFMQPAALPGTCVLDNMPSGRLLLSYTTARLDAPAKQRTLLADLY